MTFKKFFKEGVEKNAPSTLYHVTKVSNLDSIFKKGLEPRLVKVPGLRTRTPRIYLFSNINADNIDMIKLFQHKIESMGNFMSPRITTPPKEYEDVAIIKVILPKGIKIYKDTTVHPRATNTYFVANKTIEPQYLEVIYQGPVQGKEKNIKNFIKKQGLEGEPYDTNAVLDSKVLKQVDKKLILLQKQANNKPVEVNFIGHSITLYTLRPLKDIKFWHQYKEPFDTDNFLDLVKKIYEGEDGYMVNQVWEEKNNQNIKNSYSLGITKKELEQILMKEFNAKIGTSESEMQDIYNELITKQGYKHLTVNK